MCKNGGHVRSNVACHLEQVEGTKKKRQSVRRETVAVVGDVSRASEVPVIQN